MTRNEEIINRLRSLKPSFRERGLRRVRVFGSVARGDSRPDSDVDILVDFDGEPSLFDLSELKIDLERELGCSVDIAFADRLIPALRERILREAQDV